MNGWLKYRPALLCLAGCGIVAFLLSVPWSAFAGQEYRKRVAQHEETFDDLEDVRAEVAFGREIAAHILGQYGLYDNAELTRYVALVGQSLIIHSGRPELDYYFAVLDSAEPNAFAAPGGYVFITRGALAVMTDESELAAVLGHEIGHINAKHIVHELKIRGRVGQGAAVVTSLIGGSTASMRTAFSQMVDMATDILLKRGYKLEDEAAADRLGTAIPALAGYDPTALVRFLNALSTQSHSASVAAALGTHKSNAERVDDLQEYLADNKLVEKPSNALRERFATHVQL